MATEDLDPARPRTSSRDHPDTRRRLERWLSARLPGATVSELAVPSGNGMSSETLLFDVSWREDGVERSESCVARLAPDPADFPVFERYDMRRQHDVMDVVARHTTVPVPRTLWYEGDDAVVGSPFFVMQRVEGRVPPDLPPYTFPGNWLIDATPAERRRLQEASVGLLAGLHELDAEGPAGFLALDLPGDTHLRRHVAAQQAYYAWATSGWERSPLVERCFAWLEDHWPADDGGAVLSWGDARIGNVLYDGFEPVAVLDWEMAGIAPREVDLGWMIYLHRFFQDVADTFEVPGLPDFMRQDDVAATYESSTGHEPRHLDFHVVYAALRYAIVLLRLYRRALHFGERPPLDDVDDCLYHRATFEAMLDGRYRP